MCVGALIAEENFARLFQAKPLNHGHLILHSAFSVQTAQPLRTKARLVTIALGYLPYRRPHPIWRWADSARSLMRAHAKMTFSKRHPRSHREWSLCPEESAEPHLWGMRLNYPQLAHEQSLCCNFQQNLRQPASFCCNHQPIQN